MCQFLFLNLDRWKCIKLIVFYIFLEFYCQSARIYSHKLICAPDSYSYIGLGFIYLCVYLCMCVCVLVFSLYHMSNANYSVFWAHSSSKATCQSASHTPVQAYLHFFNTYSHSVVYTAAILTVLFVVSRSERIICQVRQFNNACMLKPSVTMSCDFVPAETSPASE